jgi:sugar phosphate isomerase/epimerase
MEPMKRKKFLQLGSLGALSTALTPSLLSGFPTQSNDDPANIAVQLYSVRKEIEKDIKATLKRIADIGFDYVETAFWPEGIPLADAARYLKDANLAVCSAHIEIPEGDQKAIMIETAKAFDCKKMIWHGWPEDIRYASAEGVKQLAAIYNKAHEFAKANGLSFGLHNHWWEFRNKIGDKFVYEILLQLLHPDIFFEIDTYWVKVAGHDPAVIIKKFGKRAPLLHIKDGPARWNESLADDNPDAMVAVGKGTQDFPSIVKAAAGNTDWMIVEVDKTEGDVFEALQDSYNYLIKNKLAKSTKGIAG